MSTSHAFKAGWQDRLAGKSCPPEYERCWDGLAIAYERGRHCAALYEYDMTRRGYHIEWPGTSLPFRPDYKLPSFTTAYRNMPAELRALIRQEKKFCSLKPRQWSA